MALRFEDYAERLVFPYYQSQGIGKKAFLHHGNLRSFSGPLRSQHKARVVTNRNDFLLNSSDLTWIRGAFGGSRLRMLADGGHLGNLGEPEVWKAILRELEDLK